MSFNDQKDLDAFKKGMDSFMDNPSFKGHEEMQSLDKVVPNNNIVVGEGRTVLQQLDAGNPVNRSVSSIQVTSLLSAKKSVTNGAQAAASLSAGKQEVAAKASAMKESWDSNKAEAKACLKEAAGEQGFDGDAVVEQVCPSSGSNNSGLGSMVTANSPSSFAVFEPSKQDKKLKPEELKSLIENTVKIAQSGGAKDTRSQASNSLGDITPNSDIAKLNEEGMEQLLTQDIEDQPEYKEAMDINAALDDVANNHGYVVENYNPTDVAPNNYDAIDVDLTGQALQGIAAIKLGNGAVATNDAHFNADISDISSKMARAGLGDDAPVYKPPQNTLDRMLGLS